MTIGKLERVMWRLRSKHKGKEKIRIIELQTAIIQEIGYSEITYKRIKKVLKKLGWIRTQKTSIELTGKDLE